MTRTEQDRVGNGSCVFLKLPRYVLCGRGLKINGEGEDVGERVETRGALHCIVVIQNIL